MKVGIIMPYYNEKELLVKSVQAIFNQTYTDWHLFLIDDGSKNGNRAYQVLDIPPQFEDKLTIVFKPNGGVSSARNFAIDILYKVVEYGAIAYCDSDDVWDVDYLEKQISALKDADMVYSNVRHIFLDGSVAVPYGIPFHEVYPGLQELLKGNFIFISGVVHRSICLSVGYFDRQLNSIEDWDYWVKIDAARYKISRNPNACFTYTVKTNGNGSRSSEDVYNKFRLKHKYLYAKT